MDNQLDTISLCGLSAAVLGLRLSISGAGDALRAFAAPSPPVIVGNHMNV
jgi:hypothetical protein